MMKKNRNIYLTKIGQRNFKNSVKRKKRAKLRRSGYNKFKSDSRKNEANYFKRRKSSFLKQIQLKPPLLKPQYSESIKFFLRFPEVFHKDRFLSEKNGYFLIPGIFSLIDNYEESFKFLKRLFDVLYAGKVIKITLDYKVCKRIDVDASICMDLLLADFIKYLSECENARFNVFPREIEPINFSDENVMKVLFSIGAYKNLKGLSIKYQDIEPLPVLINSQTNPLKWEVSEVHQTKIVEYIKICLKRFNEELTVAATTEFYKVIGEIMANAEEHGTEPNRYAIGFFQEKDEQNEHFGIFNFSIFNFGKTIYQTFKNSNTVGSKIIEQMTDLSKTYTERGLFKTPQFREEALWTLYSLQEGITSTGEPRGNGSIQFIENFFKLKGDMTKDDISKLVIMSGNTRILFDGSYKIHEKENTTGKKKFKLITFNESGDISDKPDENFVTFAPHFFPGTMISARILIKFGNVNLEDNEKRNDDN